MFLFERTFLCLLGRPPRPGAGFCAAEREELLGWKVAVLGTERLLLPRAYASPTFWDSEQSFLFLNILFYVCVLCRFYCSLLFVLFFSSALDAGLQWNAQ